MVLAGRAKLRVSKNFFRGHLFAFAEYLCNRNPKIKTKNVKMSQIKIWLDDSPPLILLTELSNHFFVILQLHQTLIAHYAI